MENALHHWRPFMNLIVIAIDTLRADFLSCYGHRHLTSPHIDKLAADGVIFRETYSPHIPTHPGFTTLFTGVDVFRHQVVCQGGGKELAEDIPTLAQILKEQGYYTSSVDNLGRWFGRGFDTVRSFSWEQKPPQPFLKAEAVNKVALQSLEECAAQDKPFFLFTHFWDPHTPYVPPKPFDRMFYSGNETDPNNKSMEKVFAFEPFSDYFRTWMGHVTDIKYAVNLYEGEIAYVDAVMASFFKRIQDLGLWDDSLICIVSDHGEELDEHGLWFDHHGLYDTNLRIANIMRCPKRLPRGRMVNGFVRMMDIAPTILDVLGFGQIPKEKGMTGYSALPLLDRPVNDNSGLLSGIYLTEDTWMRKRGWRTREWKLILSLEPDCHGLPPVELYHLPSDPGEYHNLAQERPDVVAALREEIFAHRSRRMAATGLPDPIDEQGITLRRVGSLAVAVPANQKLAEKK